MNGELHPSMQNGSQQSQSTHVRKNRAGLISYSHWTLLENVLTNEQQNDEQTKYLERITQLEKTLVQRTLVVTRVAENPIKNKLVLRNLKKFFETKLNAKVEKVFLATSDGRKKNKVTRHRTSKSYNMETMVSEGYDTKGPPPIFVRFYHERDVNRILKPSKGKPRDLECPGIGRRVGPGQQQRSNSTLNGQNNTEPRLLVSGQERAAGRSGGRGGRAGRANTEGCGDKNTHESSLYQKESKQSGRGNRIAGSLEKIDRPGIVRNSGDAIASRDVIHIQKPRTNQNLSADLLDSAVIEFSVADLAFGHWTSDDIYTTWINRSNTSRADDSNSTINQSFNSTGSVCNDKQQLTCSDEYGEWIEAEKLLNPAKDIMLKIDIPNRMIELSVSRLCDSREEFEFSDSRDFATFRFKDIDGYIDLCTCLYESDDDNPPMHSLILNLKFPPRLYTDKPVFGLGFAFENQSRENTRDIVFGGIHASTLGSYHSMKLDLPYEYVEALLLNKALRTLQSFGMFRPRLLNVCDTRHVRAVILTQEMKVCIHSSVDHSIAELHKADPSVGFIFRSLLDSRKFSAYHLTKDTSRDPMDRERQKGDIFSFLRAYPKHAALEALTQMSKTCGKTKFPCKLLLMMVDLEFEETKTLDPHCVGIPRLYLTPSRQVAAFIEVETSNRFVRRFVEEEGFRCESFLRLQVCEENFDKFYYSDLTDVVVSRINAALTSGIVVNEKRYWFLAYSSSQLKDFSLWMVYPERGWTAQSMRDTMGDFSMCRNPSEYSARIGQCLSTTFQGLVGQDAITVGSQHPPLKHLEIQDICAKGNMIHSDGCGAISGYAMTKLLEKLPRAAKSVLENTSGVQIRYGGAKGFLVKWEQAVIDKIVGRKSSPYDVLLRKSMVKFKADYKILEICRIACFVPYYLNRNVILLLGAHRVGDDIFRGMQKEMLDDLERMLRCRQTAINMLSRLGGPDQIQRTRILNILRSGLSPDNDPFLFSCCLAIRSHHLYGLRKKARIYTEKGVVLMGGVDETALLPQFCVFLQIRKNPGMVDDPENDFQPIVGPVMITKHPVMHPGDVRMLLAVDIPQLRDKKNVLLFSQHGDRPEPNKMSGSDLDGDEYAITWDSRLFLGSWNSSNTENGAILAPDGQVLSSLSADAAALLVQKVNHAPLTYDTNVRRKNARITPEGLVDHLINYVKNDNLGRIGMLWQDWAALKGADCEQCIALAIQHSVAVDFAKTGIPASIPDNTKWNGTRAHWREKTDEPFYHCSKILGQLYDDVIKVSKKENLQDFMKRLAGRQMDRYGQVLAVKKKGSTPCLQDVYMEEIPKKLGWAFGTVEVNRRQQRMECFASEQHHYYEEHVIQLMNKYNLRSEGELFTGCIRKYHRLHKMRQFEVAEELRRHCREMCGAFKRSFFVEVLSILKWENAQQVQDASASATDPFGTIVEYNFDDEAIEDAMIAAAEACVGDNPSSNKWKVRTLARELAAAYYLQTYSPNRAFHNDFALFSFPWLVADVVAACMQEHDIDDDSSEHSGILDI